MPLRRATLNGSAHIYRPIKFLSQDLLYEGNEESSPSVPLIKYCDGETGLTSQRCDHLRLTGSGGSNRVMEAELKRLVMRSSFDVRLEKPQREGDATLLFPFDARVAWVAACHHRTSSRISWDLCSSDAVRLEPLFEDLVPMLSSDSRLPAEGPVRFSVEVGAAADFEASPLQLRGVVKNAIVDALRSRAVESSSGSNVVIRVGMAIGLGG